MKAIIIADSLRGGLGAAATEHAVRLSAHFDVVLVAPTADAHLMPAGIEAVSIDLPLNFFRALRAGSVGAIRQCLEREEPDLVHVHGLRSFALARLAGADPWITMHGFVTAPGAARWNTAARRLVRRAIPYLSHGRAFTVAPGAPRGWEFLPHASPRLPHLQFVGAGQSTTFAWVGRLDTPKRPELFIEALAQLDGAASGLMFGDGPLAVAMQQLIDSRNAPVRLAGHVVDVEAELAAVRGVVLLSHSEGVPFAIEEAMWMGKPVIVSRGAGLTWLAGDSALYADSVDELVQAMRQLLDDRAATRAGERAAERVRRQLSADAPWPALDAMYRESARTGSHGVNRC